MTMIPEKNSGMRGILDIINPILAGVSLGRGGKWGIAGGIGSLGAQIADALWRQRNPSTYIDKTAYTGGKPKKAKAQKPIPRMSV